MSDYTTYTEAAKAVAADTTEALQLVYDTLNQGQQKKLAADEKVKALFDRYGVQYDAV